MELSRRYYSKLLLFGEYTVLLGGHALAIPLKEYASYWQQNAKDPRLEAFLEQLYRHDFLDPKLIDSFRQEEYSFVSNIPIGYGLGSSAAITAAVYDLFAKEKATDLALLKHQLGRIEDFFHGNSSGLDALCVYLEKGILFKSSDDLQVLDELELFSDAFLVDSKVQRNSKNLIQIFQSKLSVNSFRQKMDELNELNHRAILSLIDGDSERCKALFPRISEIQFECFTEMIPDSIKDMWRKGLDSGEFSLKLCGAGGGGMFIGKGKIDKTESIRYIS